MKRHAFSDVVANAIDQAELFAILMRRSARSERGLLIVAANAVFEKNTGYSLPEVENVPIELLQLKLADGKPLTAENFQSNTAPREATLRTKDGKILRFECQLGRAIDPEDGAVCLTLLGRVPPPKPEDAEQITQQLLAGVFMSVNVPMAVVTPDGQLIAANPALAALLSEPVKLLHQKSFWDFVAPEEKLQLLRKYEADFRAGNQFSFEAMFLRADNAPIALDLAVTVSNLPKLKRFRIITFTPRAAANAPPLKNQIIAGQIQLLGLDEVKASLGSRWDAYAEKAMMVAEHILAARLGPDDVFVRTADKGFLIRFADPSEQQASSRAAKIAREIRDRLIGQDQQLSGCAVTAITTAVDLKAGESQGSRESILQLLEQRLNARRVEIERAARAELNTALATAKLEREELFDRAGQAVPITFVRLNDNLEERIEVAATSLPTSEIPDFELDITALRLTLAAEAALGDIQHGRKSAYLVPIEFSLFNNRRHVEGLLRLCRPLQGSVRQRVMFVIGDIPRTVAQSRLHEVVKLLEPFSIGVAFELSSISDLPADLSQFRIPLMVVDRQVLLDAKVRSATQLDKLLRRLQLSSSRLVARGIENADERQAVIDIGAHMVSYARGASKDAPSAALPGAVSVRERFEAATYAAAINSATAGITITDATSQDHPMILCNPAFRAMTGYSVDELVGRNPRMLQGPATDPAMIRELRDAVTSGVEFRREILNYRKDGSSFWNELAISPVRDPQGKIIAHVGLHSDVTERRRAEAAGQRASRMLQHLSSTMPGFIFQRVMRANGTIDLVYISQSFARLIGAPADRVLNNDLFLDRLHPDDREHLETEIRRSARELTLLTVEYRLIAFDGTTRWIRTHSQPALGDKGDVVWSGLGLDITAEKSVASELSYIASHDPLTGLANRSHFQRRIEAFIEGVEARHSAFAVAYIDLSDFSAINDALGQSMGDMILHGLGQRLSTLDEGEIVARIGGDEFAVALLSQHSPEEFKKRAAQIGRIISSPLLIEGEKITVRACIGIAIYPGAGYGENASTSELARQIIKAADVALAEAKTSGSGSVCLYSPEMDDRIRNKVALEQGLHQALEDRQFDLHFQPIVDLETHRIVAAEALVRWQHPTLGLQRPDQFIPIAEATGQIVPLGAWIIETALARLREWGANGDNPPRLAINVSGVQMKSPGFFDFVTEAIASSGVDAKFIELELTETAIVDCSAQILGRLAELRSLGVTIAIDDFGTGYSSFRYLRDLPIDKIKIDQSFVRRMVVNSSDAAIVKGIIAIARDLDLRVVVEGIETAEQRDFLRDEGCRIGQGYFFSMPLLEDDFVWMFRNGIQLPLNKNTTASTDARPSLPAA